MEAMVHCPRPVATLALFVEVHSSAEEPPGGATHHASCCPVSTAALRSGPLLLLRLHGGVARHCCHYCLVVRPVAADATLALLVEAQRRNRQVEQLITAAPA